MDVAREKVHESISIVDSTPSAGRVGNIQCHLRIRCPFSLFQHPLQIILAVSYNQLPTSLPWPPSLFSIPFHLSLSLPPNLSPSSCFPSSIPAASALALSAAFHISATTQEGTSDDNGCAEL